MHGESADLTASHGVADMQPQYRILAKERLAKASKLVATGDNDDLVYACLELRKCIEAMCYELLTAYLGEVPLKAFEIWQPDKVMKELLRTDPGAEHTTRIRIKEEGRGGAPDGEWMDLGEDRRLTAAWAAKAYHQLGSFLHVPTIRQAREGISLDTQVSRERAEAIRAHLAHALDTSIWNANFSVFVNVLCTECETPIKRRAAILEKNEPVECGNCGQLFDAEPQSDGRYLFVPHSFSWTCKACGEARSIVQSKAKDGVDVSCPKCGDRAVMYLERRWVLIREAENMANAPAATSD